MRDYGIDGVWLQHFLVDLPSGPIQDRYRSRTNVLRNVQNAARQTGRTWAIAFDISGMPADRITSALTNEWKRLVDSGVTEDERYLHEKGLPVVEVWGFYWGDNHNAMTPAVGNQIVDFLKSPGRYHAFLVGGGDWNWRQNPDPDWRTMLHRLDAYSPWNIGNASRDNRGVSHADTSSWMRRPRMRGTWDALAPDDLSGIRMGQPETPASWQFQHRTPQRWVPVGTIREIIDDARGLGLRGHVRRSR